MVAGRRPGRQAGGVELDAAVDELYGLDPEEFMAARTARVAAARQAKDRPLAASIGALKKPTRSAWLVNLLARSAADEVRRLGELATAMAAAHAGADLAELRGLGTQRQRLIDELTRRAVALGAERGYQATEAVRLEVSGTFGAAVADPASLADVQAGRVVKALVYSGFGFPLTPSSDAVAASAPLEAAPAAAQPGDDDDAAGRAEADRRARAQQAFEAATEVLIEARTGLKAAEASEGAAREALDRASHEVADLRAELRAAEQAEASAREALTASEDELHEARTAVQAAEGALAAAARGLS